MMGRKKALAGIVAAIFTVALFEALVCSTVCAMDVGLNQVQHSDSHDGHHSLSRRSHSPFNRSSESPDCSKLEHSVLPCVKTVALSQFQLSITGHLSTAELPASSLHDISMTASRASDLSPPPTLKIPLYQQIPVLRI